MIDLQNYFCEKENRLFFVHTVDGAVTELNRITLNVNNDLEKLNNNVINDLRISQDAEKIATNILKLLQGSQNIYNNIFLILKSSYENWLKKVCNIKHSNTEIPNANSFSSHNINNSIYINTNNNNNKDDEKIVDIDSDEDSMQEVQIVNEIKYLHRKEGDSNKLMNDTWYSKIAQNNQDISNIEAANKTDDQIYEPATHKTCQPVTHKTSEPATNETFEEKADETYETEIDETSEAEVDEKLQFECVVLIERLPKKLLDSHKNSTALPKKKKITDEEFNRCINLDTLERKKRQHSEDSDDSRSDYSKTRTSHKNKKTRLTNSDSDESSSSCEFSSSDSEIEQGNNDSETFSDDSNTWNNSIPNEDEGSAIKNKLYKSLVDNNSSSESEDESDSTEDNSTDEKIKTVKKTNGIAFPSIKPESKIKPAWMNDDLLKFTLPGFNSNTNNRKRKEKLEKEKNTSSESDGNDDDDDYDNMYDDDYDNNHRHTEKQKSKKKSRMLESEFSKSSCSSLNDVSSSEETDDCHSITENSQKTIDLTLDETDQSKSTKLSGRRNIRKVFDDEQIGASTKQAAKDEEHRLKRLADRHVQALKINNDQDEELIVLDADLKTQKKLVTVDKGLVRHLKDHQKKGVKFMWDSCFESLERTQNTEGSGCILAHCMGLGKTLQVITLVQTLLSNKDVGVEKILIVCPKNTILNWVDEFETWLKVVENRISIPKIYELTQVKKSTRIDKLNEWTKKGGVLILSYDMFRNFTTQVDKLNMKQKQNVEYCLLNPGADLIVCDEGHMLKNDGSIIANEIQKIKTKRRIVLTGTPLQNNLKEYHCMVQFVKPNLLGTKKEFLNRFVNPITNGQFDNSNIKDVTLMKQRAHVLHRMLEGCVQRCDYEVLTEYLPRKQEYTIKIRLSPIQTELYNHYVDSAVMYNNSARVLLVHYNELIRLIAHPKCLFNKFIQKNDLFKNAQSVQDIKNYFIPTKENNNASPIEPWWLNYIKDEHMEDINTSYKMSLFFEVLSKCEELGDKLLVFSRSLQILDGIQMYLKKNFRNQWRNGHDFFRLDGKIDCNERNKMCKKFNDPMNKRARLFLISTKAGGLGINLIGANRVIIFDPSWNPSDDLQSIFRIFRFGQKKDCCIYRFIGAGSMEENIYNRQVNKLSLSLRVIDEQQVGRHFKEADLAELYRLKQLDEEKILRVPTDKLLADVLAKHNHEVYDFFEHDSLLQNKEEEELGEEERLQAWNEYHEMQARQAAAEEMKKAKQNQIKRVQEQNIENGTDINSEQRLNLEEQLPGPSDQSYFQSLPISPIP